MRPFSEMRFLVVWLFLVVRSVSSAQLVKEGIGFCTGYPRSLYRAFNYQPFCGTLDPGAVLPVTMDYVCNTAMARFRAIPDPFALYDLTGLRLPNAYPIAVGVEMCMCYSMGEVLPATGMPKKANFCTYVSPTGLEKLWGGYSLGIYEAGSKALPQCYDINLATATASIALEASQAASTIILPDIATGTRTSTRTSTRPSQTGYSSCTCSASTRSRHISWRTLVGATLAVMISVLANNMLRNLGGE